ncbi:NADH-dependent flavin oxidoreductase [Peribacillus simplex]|uniref:NADH-dependent flavin oxidoreductase n=2 Tax=Peribacillus simplex TaxID=1478 RepID=A0A223ECM2_9BACI|nr:NADH-dependent flavin oxidoreductase [Peribacillus simplex]ASS92996.1 NADH-dependent flavin oxidoreductase [Peribacillus simplex NBRC 15720 = DSM 1321]MEC1400188.1 NADH-dependent flavin oxidoreductase [Peribacillus simplex]MED3912413.1 NADH-dependent flavin oxidoreductase [Peribacillus simplex]TVX78480.1 NADH-dependent flavin oxidoreductase [Peribacillus simplex]
MNSKYIPLFESFNLGKKLEVKNRLVMAPMTNFSSNPDGTVTDAEVNYYERRSSGVGMVITACTYVTANGKGFHGEFGGDKDELIPSLSRLASAIKAKGSKAILQIFHGGREVPPELIPNGDVVSASNIPSEGEGKSVPRPLSEKEIESIILDFGEATRRAIEAGFDGVEIHGANGYLLQQFFSPHSNRREDKWGGSLEKRLTFPLAVVDEVKKAVAEHAKVPFIVGYRFSPEEPETPGITMEDTLALIDGLVTKELDYLHVSLMDFWSKARRGAEVDRPRIEIIKERIGDQVPLIGVGSIYTADDAIKALQSGVPLIALGREIIIDPEWVQKVEQGREAEIVTKINKDNQQKLDIPDPLWQAIIHSPGWFPGIE